MFPGNVLPVLQTFGDIGLALYMFSLGSRLDTHLMLCKSLNAILISLSGIILPFLLGGSLAFPLYLSLHSPLQTRVSLIQGSAMWLICLLLFAIACLGKMLGGIFATRVAGESWKDSLAIGVLMNTRGLAELIALNIGLDLGVLSPALFAMLVIMAIITTMMLSPLLVLLGCRSEHMQSASEAAVEQVIP